MGDRTRAATLRDLIDDGAASYGDKAYLEDARSDRTVSYAALARAVADWRRVFAHEDVASDASVLLDIDDPLDFSIAYLAVIASGRCAVPLDPAMPAGEFARALTTLRPALIIGDAHGSDGPIPRLPAHPAPGSDHSDEPTRPGRQRLRTSGSTGEPKVVELTEAQLLHVARAVAGHNGLTADDRGFNPLPLFHINGEVVALLATLVAGSTLVLDRRFHRDGFWPLMAQRHITWINAVPAILTILSREPIAARPSSLRLVRSASASLPDAVRTILTDALGEIVIESYGMTEAASQITATTAGHRPPPGSAGRPVGVELRICDDANQAVPAGEIGRVWLRGPGVVDHYVGGRAPERFHDGWLDSGDLGHQDADGNLFLVGRSDDVINRGGQLVYPREIEEVLLGHDTVLDAIVVGRPDEILGAVPVAYVIAGEGATEDSLLAELDQRCREQLSRYKRPVTVTLVDDLPRAATGKIRRSEVRAAAMSLMS